MTLPSDKTATINVTPLIDILLVLLIIFLVITPRLSHGIDAALPQTATNAVTVQPEAEIILEITHEHEFLLNGKAVPRADLANEIKKIYSSRADRQLFIRGDKDLEYREVALAMDDVRGAESGMQFGLLGRK
jgi:biopolymer transport protein TolR